MEGTVKAVCTSSVKGVRKEPVKEARLIEERKVSGNDYSDALEAELTDLARQIGALGADGKLTDLLA